MTSFSGYVSDGDSDAATLQCLGQAETIDADAEKRRSIWQMAGEQHEFLLYERVGRTSDTVTIPYICTEVH